MNANASSAAWAVIEHVSKTGTFAHVGYHKPPKDRTESSIRWSLLFFLATSIALWAWG